MATASAQTTGSFLINIEKHRLRTRQHIAHGGVTDVAEEELATVIRLLNEVLATEIVCVQRYKRYYFLAKGIHSQAVAEEFLDHADEKQHHVDLLAERIHQLNGEPNFNPEGILPPDQVEYSESRSLGSLIHEDLIAEQIAMDSYTEIIDYLSDSDPISQRLIKAILSEEMGHAAEMHTLVEAIEVRERYLARKLPVTDSRSIAQVSSVG